MLDVDAIGTCCRAALALTAVILLRRYLLASTLIEEFRQRMFDLRREVFMLQVNGKLSAADPSYIWLVRSMNGLIRFAESISFGRLLIMFISESDEPDALDEAVAETSPQVAEIVKQYRIRMGYEILRHATLMSPLVFVMLLVVIPLFKILAAVESTRRRLDVMINKLVGRPAIRHIETNAGEMLPDEFARA